MGCLGECMAELNAYRIIMGVNVLIAIFGTVILGIGVVALVEFEDDAFFSRQIYGVMILFGLLSFVLVLLACVGGKAPNEYPNYLFCYWCLVSLLIAGNLIAIFTFNTFIDSLANAENANAQDLGVIETQFAKQSSDFALSVYTGCCTGCVNKTECIEPIFPGDNTGGEIFCLPEDNCEDAELCNEADFEVSGNGLGQGCYITLEKIPGFGVSVDTCAVFENLEIVGPAAGGRCGGGDSARFVTNTANFFQDRYFRIIIPWSFFVTLLCLAWFAAVFMILFHSGGSRDRKR